jgi:hypothetical protein
VERTAGERGTPRDGVGNPLVWEEKWQITHCNTFPAEIRSEFQRIGICAQARERMSGIDPIKHKQHDIFNLITLPLLILALFHYCYSVYFLHQDDFLLLYLTGQLYFAIDMIWLMLWPRSVSSPTLILIHHFLSSLGWCLPLYVPVLGKWVASCFLVEVNTFLLIARRNVPNNNLSLRFLITSCFHLSWVLLRLILYPTIVYHFSFEVLDQFHLQGTLFNFYSVGWVVVFALTCLNLKWSYELYFTSIHTTGETRREKVKEGL